jgi:DNA polymerase
MDASERKDLWENLCAVEDWLAGAASCSVQGKPAGLWGHEDGMKRARALPDFDAASLAAAQSAGERQGTSPTATAADRAALSPKALPGDSLERIASEIARCTACRLASTRCNTVPGQGVPVPVVLVVGEGPGSEEDASGLPFVGPAGRLLDKMLQAIGLSRTTNCHIANVVKCRPPMNRDPAPDEEAACRGYLDRQIALLGPRVILCVGRVATQSLVGTKEGISRLRGRELSYAGIPLVATFHPSALLRDETLKRPAWEDLKRLRGILTDG